MAIQTARRRTRENRFVLTTDWQGYMKFREAVGERHVRVTYDSGVLEIMTTSPEHESVKSLLARLAEVLFEELEIRFITGGSPTFNDETLDKAIEPDDCFWIEHVAERLAQMPDEEGAQALSPDLAIEIEVSRSVLNRLRIHASLGIGEVWRWHKGHVEVYCLQPHGTYERKMASPKVPRFPMNTFREYLSLRHSLATSDILRRFRAWVREHRQQLV